MDERNANMLNNKPKKKTVNKSSRNLLIVLAAFFGVLGIFILATPAIDNIVIPGTPARDAMPPQRQGIVDIQSVPATVRDNEGNLRNINASVALDFDDSQVRNYNVNELRTIVMDAIMQLDGEMFENVYDLTALSVHIRDQLGEYVNPEHLRGVHITEMESGEHPIARDPQDGSQAPRGATWRMN
ncbi:MAG: hypothetical protein FWE20_08965 [Defluviitaleaceae bacterium]|nr:hypothetical protein [Defluviitaleaceae bacterium]